MNDRVKRRGLFGVLVPVLLAGVFSCSPPDTGPGAPGADDGAGALFRLRPGVSGLPEFFSRIGI